MVNICLQTHADVEESKRILHDSGQ